MTEPTKGNILGSKIAALLENGIRLTEDVVHYIDSTFSNPDMGEFGRILSDVSNCDTQPLIELIFYPDADSQEKLEPVLMTDDFCQSDVETAVSYLAAKNMAVPVIFPDQRGRCEFQPTESVIRQFVMRLRPDKKIDSRLAETIARYMADMADQIRARVLIRHCRIALSEPVADFLCRFMETMAAASPRFWEAFAFLIDFFECGEPATDIYGLLMRKKKEILRSIDQAEKSEIALRQQSVEAMMLRGMTIVSIDMADARQKTVLIDHICISMFGKTELFGMADQIQTLVDSRNFLPPKS